MAGVKGRSGPKQEKPWREALILELNRVAEDDREKRKKLSVVAEACVTQAMAGEIGAISEIANRLDGKAVQSLEIPEGSGFAIHVHTVAE